MEHCRKCDIVYNERDCPLCEANDKISDLLDKVNNLQDTIADLEREI